MKNTYTFTFQDHTIIIQLPRFYSKKPTRHYPAVLTQDGDSLFKSIQRHDVIFIGIEPIDRAHDYTPWMTEHNLNGGGADNYLTWLTTELIPHLRHHYRISPNNDDLTIAGASYGGLLTLYALLTMPDQFGNYIILSPSMWYPDIFSLFGKGSPALSNKKIYWYVGGHEGMKHTKVIKPMVRNNKLAVQKIQPLLTKSHTTFIFETNKHGIHRQSFFTYYFKRGLRKLKINKKGS
ncbi:alpha/beta hydrolase-fold protein [Staphylococcus caledonicus]|uniref:alpha/beta hydrolase n=1 Tax=Staphylococcus sp. acrmy TaxID=2929076 RepID=UPI001F5B00B5|nr:alpha/beta hydrolase-fold protein [Staphylococcus sp. acrmy]MCI2947101.1 alpha/beta hydrolase-fold protein [Staphylococcus sp. acrmy]